MVWVSQSKPLPTVKRGGNSFPLCPVLMLKGSWLLFHPTQTLCSENLIFYINIKVPVVYKYRESNMHTASWAFQPSNCSYLSAHFLRSLNWIWRPSFSPSLCLAGSLDWPVCGAASVRYVLTGTQVPWLCHSTHFVVEAPPYVWMHRQARRHRIMVQSSLHLDSFNILWVWDPVKI